MTAEGAGRLSRRSADPVPALLCVISPDEARALAQELLAADSPRRWQHVRAVGHRAAEISRIAGSDADVLIAAAWLHDVGYSGAASDTGFHPLDGARWLVRAGLDGRVAALVAHHSCALLEAEERGLAEVLRSEFTREETSVADALWYCDMTTGPDGERLTATERIAEIKTRYGLRAA